MSENTKQAKPAEQTESAEKVEPAESDEVAGLDLHKTGVGPAPVVARVTSRIAITGGWILDVQFLDHNQPSHARVRVYTTTDIHVNDTIAIAGRPSISVG